MKYNTQIVLAFFKEEGLPDPKVEHVFHPERKWRFDFSFEDRVGLECDGGAFVHGAHVRGGHLRREHEKMNAAAELGYRVLHVFPEDLCTLNTVNMIKRCLEKK